MQLTFSSILWVLSHPSNCQEQLNVSPHARVHEFTDYRLCLWLLVHEFRHGIRGVCHSFCVVENSPPTSVVLLCAGPCSWARERIAFETRIYWKSERQMLRAENSKLWTERDAKQRANSCNRCWLCFDWKLAPLFCFFDKWKRGLSRVYESVCCACT